MNCGLTTPFCRQSSYQQSIDLSRQASISLVTAEGDLVSISGNSRASYALAADRAITSAGNLQSLTLAGFTQENFTLQVQGDLSEEELGDISRLLGELTAIAGDFFNGAPEKAVAGALSLGDMGSISRLQASFIESSTIIQKNTVTDALPAATDLMDYHQMLQAQWRQIKEWLEDRTGELGSPNPPETPQTGPTQATAPPSERMLAKIRETTAQHPRLTPFAGALGDLAIQRAAKQTTQNRLAEDLQARFADRLNHWLCPLIHRQHQEVL